MGSTGSSPVRWRTASPSEATGKISAPSMQLTSPAQSAGSMKRRTPRSMAEMTIGSAPRTGRTAPFSESSPNTHSPPRASWSISPMQASVPRAMGRSKAGPSFFRSAGARFTISRSAGNW